MADEDRKWVVLIPPAQGTGAASVIGPFETEEAGWDYVAGLSREERERVYVLRMGNPV